MKFSKQRLLIHNAVKDNRIHPTADEVYAMLKPKNPNLSLGTVYRNLNNLAKSGDIIKIHLPNGGDRFDADTSDHFHYVCTECNKVFDLVLPQATKAIEDVISGMSFEVDDYQLVFNGRCDCCKKNKS